MRWLRRIVDWLLGGPCDGEDDSCDCFAAGFAAGEAARDKYVLWKLSEGKILRMRADGTPVWVRERRNSGLLPGEIRTGDASADNAHLLPADGPRRAAPVPDLPEALDNSPDWREQTLTELSALSDEVPGPMPDEVGRSGPVGTGHLPPLDRTPWLREHMGRNAAELEDFEARINGWLAGSAERVDRLVEELIES
jgi:hypothetical protein